MEEQEFWTFGCLFKKKKKKDDDDERTLTDLSEEGTIEGHSVEAVYRPHANIQVHQEPLLLQSVDCGANPLQKEQTPQQPSVAAFPRLLELRKTCKKTSKASKMWLVFQTYQHRRSIAKVSWKHVVRIHKVSGRDARGRVTGSLENSQVKMARFGWTEEDTEYLSHFSSKKKKQH